jgi:hypothetical protein
MAGAVSAKPTKRQSNWGQNDGAGNVVCKWNTSIAAGDLLIATVTYTGGTGTSFTVPTSLSGQTWTEIGSSRSDQGTNIGVRMFYIQNSSVHAIGNEPTWTVSPTNAEVVLELNEFTGVETTGGPDATGIANGTTVSTPTTGVVTAGSSTDDTSELSFVVFGVRNASSTLGTPTSGFSAISNAGTAPLTASNTPTTANTITRDAYVLLSAAGSGNSASMTMTGTGFGWAAAIATFKIRASYWIGTGTYPARPGTPDPAVCYGFFDDDGCWSTSSGGSANTTSPGANDVAVFDGNGLGNVTFNPNSAGTEFAYSIQSTAAYTGNASVTNRVGDNPDLTTTSRLTWGGSGTFSVNASQVTLGTGAASANQRLAITAGTFDAGTGSVIVDGVTNMNGTGTFSGATATETFSQALQLTAGTMTVGTATNSAGAATIGATGTLTLGAVGMTFPTSLTITGGTFNAGSGSITVNTTTAVSSGGTFNGNASALTLTGNVTVGAAAAYGTFNGSSSSMNLSGTLVVRGSTGGNYATFNAGSGTTTVTGNSTVDQSGIFNANTSTLNFTGTVTVGATTPTIGTFNANTATISFNNAAASGVDSLRIRGGSGFTSGAANLTFGKNAASGSNAINLSVGTMDLSSAASTTFNPSPGSGNVTVASGTTLTLGVAAATFPQTVTVAGTLTDGNGARTFSGPLALTGTYVSGSGAHTFSSTVDSSGTLTLTNAASLGLASTLTVTAGVTTFGAQTVTVAALAASGGTFDASASTLTVSGATTITGGAVNLASPAGPTLNGAVSISTGSLTLGAGSAALHSTLSLTNTAGTFTGGGGLVTITGAVDSIGTITLGLGGATLQSTLTITRGTFFASGTVAIAGDTNINSYSGGTGTFDALTSTTTFSGMVTVGGSAAGGNTRGVFHGRTATLNFAFTTSVGSPNSLLLRGASNTIFDVTTAAGQPFYATVAFGQNTIAGTNSINLQAGTLLVNGPSTPSFNGSGNVTIASGTTMTMGNGTATFPATVTVAGGLVGGTGTLTFSGAVSVSGTFSGGVARTFSSTLDVTAGSYTCSNTTEIFMGAVTASGGTMDLATSSPSLSFSSTLFVSGGAVTLGSQTVTVPAVNVSSGTFDGGTSKLTVTGATTVSGGTATFASDTRAVALNGGVTVSGGTLNLSSAGAPGATTLGSGSSLHVSSGTMNGGTTALTLQGNITVDGGTVNLGSGATVLNNSATLLISSGTFATGSGTFSVTTAASTTTVSGGAFTAGGGNVTLKAAIVSGGNMTLGSGTSALQSTLAVSTGTFTAGSGGLTVTGTTIVGTATPTVGTFNAGSGTITFTGVFSLLGGSAFNGQTSSATFTAAPTLTSGTFSVGTTGTTGIHTFSASTTFASGVTLSFPSNKGELRLADARTLTLNGTVTSAYTGSTLPKIDCNGCPSGITIAFGTTSILNIDGLELDNSVAGGVTIADGATYTLLKHLTFASNVANSIVSGATHLAITSANAGGTKLIIVPGCTFDATAQYNVTLSGIVGSTGVRAIFEDQGTNGARAGASFDRDADTNGDNVADSTTANRYGAVVEWTFASPADTSGTTAGPPTSVFNWNTFAYLGVYATFNNIGGGTTDRLWKRSADGSSAYFFDMPAGVGDVVGSPRFDSIASEAALGVDVDGDGATTSTNLQVVYIGTTGGHVIKLIDNGSTAFTRPGSSSPWNTDFTSASVATISSPLISDGTNVYFGGTDGSAVTKIFGVQITGGINEKTLQKNILTTGAGAVTAAPAWGTYNSRTYLFVGSAASGGQAYVYRVEVSPGATIDTGYAGPTMDVNGAVNLINNRAYAVTEGGQLFALDASNFNTGGFTAFSGFPYQNSPVSPIRAAPFVDPSTNDAYFGDVAGKLYIVTSTGANLAGYPYPLSGTPQLTSTPYYRRASGTVAVGAADGYVYFINRHADVANNPAIRKRYFVGTGTVSSVSFNSNSSQYMVATSDGHMAYISASDVGVDADGFE